MLSCCLVKKNFNNVINHRSAVLELYVYFEKIKLKP